MKAPRFDAERFIDDCKHASQEPTDTQASVQEVLAQAVANPGAVLSGLGSPQQGGIQICWQRRDAGLAWDIDRIVRIFEQSNDRFFHWRKRGDRLM